MNKPPPVLRSTTAESVLRGSTAEGGLTRLELDILKALSAELRADNSMDRKLRARLKRLDERIAAKRKHCR